MKTVLVFVFALTLLFAFFPVSSVVVDAVSIEAVQDDDVACRPLRAIGRGLRGIGRGVGRAFGAGRSC